MSQADLLRAAAGALLALGLGGLFLAWRDRGRAQPGRRLRLCGGWLALALGTGLWARADSVDVGAAQAVAAAMLLALAGVGAHSLSLTPPRKPPRETVTKACAAPPAPGWSMRLAARLAGSVAAAPAFGLALGLAAARCSAGEEVTRLMGFAVVGVLAAAAGLIWVLAARQPVRATATLAGAAFLLVLLATAPGGRP